MDTRLNGRNGKIAYSSEKELIQIIQKDTGIYREYAFADLVQHLDGSVRQTIKHFGPAFDEFTVEDVAQQTWMVVADKIFSYEDYGIPLSHWVNSIARWKTLDYCRKLH